MSGPNNDPENWLGTPPEEPAKKTRTRTKEPGKKKRRFSKEVEVLEGRIDMALKLLKKVKGAGGVVQQEIVDVAIETLEGE